MLQVDTDRAARLLVLATKMARPRASARAEGSLHKIADTHTPKLEVAVRYAFAMARKAMRGPLEDHNTTYATAYGIATLREELRSVLPKVLRRMYVAGGEVGAKNLGLRTLNCGTGAGGFQHGNDCAKGGSGDNPLAGEKSGEHTPAGQRKLIDYLEKTTGEKFKPHGSVGRGETSKNDFDIIMKPQSDEDATEAAHKFESDLHDRLARGEITQDQMMQELYGGEFEHPVDKALKNIGFEHESSIEFDASPTGDSGDPEVAVMRYKNPKTGHTVEVWVPMRALAEFRTAKRESKPKIEFTFDAKRQSAIDWADRHAAEMINSISETSREAINNAVAEYLESGNRRDLLDEILAAVGDEDRAALIARHEPMAAVHAGQREAWEQATQAGLLTGDEEREWIVVGDEKVCPTCEGLEGKRAKLGESYVSDEGEFEGPPAHVMCRCSEGIVS